MQVSPSEEDEVVWAFARHHLLFTKDGITITRMSCPCFRKPRQLSLLKIRWADITSKTAEWHCFSGALQFCTKEATYSYKMTKAQLMKAVSAMKRRVEKPVGDRTKAFATKLRFLLEGSSRAGVSNSGMIYRKRLKWWSCRTSALYTPWNDIISTRVVRNCMSGRVTLGTKSSNYFFRGDADILTKFGVDPTNTKIVVKTTRSTSEGFYALMTSILNNNFSHMEELPGMHIHNKNAYVKATKAGIFLESEIGCCGKVVKSFIPWESLVIMRRRGRTCCRKGGFFFGDRQQAPINAGEVTTEDFVSMQKIFSETVKENGMKTSGEALQGKFRKGVTLGEDGIHERNYFVKCSCCCCCCPNVNMFVPWARIDGLRVKMSSCRCLGATLYLITEAGHSFAVMKSRNMELLWQKYDEVHQEKFGVACSEFKTFNADEKDPNKSCKLTNQSLKLCYSKGKIIEEVDLERVVGARVTKANRLEVALSLGQESVCTVLGVKLKDPLEADSLVDMIRGKAEKRKSDLKALTRR